MFFILSLLFVTLLGCMSGPIECSPPTIFAGPTDDTVRFEQLSRPSRETAVRVALLPEDVGRRLRVYPTTSSDVWAPDGALTFVRADGSEIYRAWGLCPADFSDKDWTVPAGAVAVVLELPTDVFAMVLFTLVIER
jgi:hypothetical protein